MAHKLIGYTVCCLIIIPGISWSSIVAPFSLPGNSHAIAKSILIGKDRDRNPFCRRLLLRPCEEKDDSRPLDVRQDKYAGHRHVDRPASDDSTGTAGDVLYLMFYKKISFLQLILCLLYSTYFEKPPQGALGSEGRRSEGSYFGRLIWQGFFKLRQGRSILNCFASTFPQNGAPLHDPRCLY